MKIIGIGNALVDIVTILKDDKLLGRYKLPKGSMTLVDRETSRLMNTETADLKKTMTSGGSAANTIHGLSNLGIKTSFIGKIGQDDLGHFFHEDMEDAGIDPVLYRSSNDTGRVIAYVSRDSERTMATYLGAALELSREDIGSDVLKDYDYLYIEGYLISNIELVSKAIAMGKKNGLKICIDLASFNIVEEYRELLLKEVLNSVDIIFANEDEARALTDLDPGDAVDMMSKICNIAIVKTGSDGSIVKQGDENIKVPAIKTESIDTTGAGDIYAAGFLYGQSNGLSLEKSARIGTLLASEVIKVMGPKLDERTWSLLRERVGDVVGE